MERDLAHRRALMSITRERVRQEMLKVDGRFAHTCADDIPNTDRLAVLIEEVGEVARAMNENDPAGLLRELVQVAAVTVAWIEGADADYYPRGATDTWQGSDDDMPTWRGEGTA